MASTERVWKVLGLLVLVALPGLSLQSCPKVNDTLIREKRLEAFRAQVLSKLGYTGGLPPNPEKPIAYSDIDPDILKQYFQAEAMMNKHNSHCPVPGDPNNFQAQRVKTVSGNMHRTTSGQISTGFPFNTKASEVTAMELTIAFVSSRTRRQTTPAKTPVTMSIYLKELDASNSTVKRDLLYTKVYRQTQLTSLQVDITSYIAPYWEEVLSATSAMVEVEIDSADELALDPEDPPSLLMFTSIEESSERRQRRQASLVADAGYCMANPTELRCCVRPLKVNFHSDLGWRWILWPQNIHINYCAGLCPYTWPTTTERFPEVLRQYRYFNPTAAPEPCCSAQKLRSIMAIVQEAPGKRPDIMMLSDMVVESCVCG